MNILETDGERLLEAAHSLLAQKGLASPAEIAERIPITDNAGPGQGARMVAKAWTDPDDRAPDAVGRHQRRRGPRIPMRGMPPLGVLENTPEVHNLVVCTLCSCYPRAVLGYPPLWYKSAAYRARAVRDPRGLLAEWKTAISPDVKVRVVGSTTEQLAAIVREGGMAGVPVPSIRTAGKSCRARHAVPSSNRAPPNPSSSHSNPSSPHPNPSSPGLSRGPIQAFPPRWVPGPSPGMTL